MSHPETLLNLNQQHQKELRVGVFVYPYGLKIADTVEVKAVAEYAKTIPHVLYSARAKAVFAHKRGESVERRMFIEEVV